MTVSVTGSCIGNWENDPYIPLEADVQLTRRALEVIAGSGFPVHVITKSDLVLRYIDLIEEIRRKTCAALTFTITTADDLLSRQLEPGAPVSSRRLVALRILSQRGLLTGITLRPLPLFIGETGPFFMLYNEFVIDNNCNKELLYILHTPTHPDPAGTWLSHDLTASIYFASLA
jgi:hypothetical protein